MMKENLPSLFLLFLALFSGAGTIRRASAAPVTGQPASQDKANAYLIVPGLGDNTENSSRYLRRNRILTPGSHDPVETAATPTSPFTADLGQTSCQNLLSRSADEIMASASTPRKLGLILYGSSQGAATVINYAAKSAHNISALVLEGALASGNSGIHLAIKRAVPLLTWLPGSYQTLPYLAKALFWRYQPAGQQAILSASKLPTDLPVIFIHAEGDRQASFRHAKALYHAVRKISKNAYFIPIKSDRHLGFLDGWEHAREIGAIHAIMKKHKLPFREHLISSSSQDALESFQPSLEDTQPFYDELMRKELFAQALPGYVRNGVLVVAAAGVVYYAYLKWPKQPDTTLTRVDGDHPSVQSASPAEEAVSEETPQFENSDAAPRSSPPARRHRIQRLKRWLSRPAQPALSQVSG